MAYCNGTAFDAYFPTSRMAFPIPLQHLMDRPDALTAEEKLVGAPAGGSGFAGGHCTVDSCSYGAVLASIGDLSNTVTLWRKDPICTDRTAPKRKRTGVAEKTSPTNM